MSENGEDESFIILSMSPKPSLESYKQSTSIDETIVKCTPVKEGLDDLTANIRLQFPSLSSSSSIKTEEMIKLQSTLEEYMELKDALQKSNIAMREHFTALQKWQDEVRTQKEIQAKQFNEFQDTVAKLRDENLALHKGNVELEHKIEQININEKSIREENREMTKMLSDKTSQIQNMAVQIEKLKQKHLDSSEYIRQLRCENEEEKESNKLKIEHEYVPILEHKRIVEDLEENVAENREMTKMLSDKTSQIQNMTVQIEKLEQQHLDSSEYIRQLRCENEEEKESNKLKIEHEYVPILEHKRIVEDLEEKLSETVAENLELDEMIQAHSKEVKELKDYIVKKNENENKEEKENNKLKIERDNATILEHRRIVREVEEKLSETFAENLELDEKIRAYSKEVKELKDYIVKTESENEVENESNKLKIESEYVTILEHRRIVKDLEEKLSETVAENLELDEMMQRFERS